MDTRPVDVADRLAQALDDDDYETARALLSPHVVYEVGDETLVGPDAVVDSYRAASTMGRQMFDELGYGHETPTPVGEGSFEVRYTDVLTIDDDTHVHYARQEITVGDGGVTRIVDRPVPGEREKVDEFISRHGISRPGS